MKNIFFSWIFWLPLGQNAQLAVWQLWICIISETERRFGSLGEYLKYKEIGAVILQGKKIIFIGNGITVFILVQWL